MAIEDTLSGAGIPYPLARSILFGLANGTTDVRLSSHGLAGPIATELARQINAKTINVQNLMALGMPGAVASAIALSAGGGGSIAPIGWVASRKVAANGTSLTARGTRASSATALQAFWDGWLNVLYFLSKGRFDWYMRRVAPADDNYQRGLWGFSYAVDSSLLDGSSSGAPVTDYTGGTWTNPGIIARVPAMRASAADIFLLEGGTIDNAGSATGQQIADRYAKLIDNGIDTGLLTGRTNKAAVIEAMPPRSSVGNPGLTTTYAAGDVRRAAAKAANVLLKALADARDPVLFSDAFDAYTGGIGEEPLLADIRAAAGNWLLQRMVDDGLHTATDGAFARARKALPIINALCPPSPAIDTSAYNASTNPFGALNATTAKMGGTAGTKTPHATVSGDVTSGFAFTRNTTGSQAVVVTLSKRTHPTLAGHEVQVLRLQSDGTGTGDETFAFDRQSNWPISAIGTEVQGFCDVRFVRGSRAMREVSLDTATRLSAGIQQQSVFGSSKLSTGFNAPYNDYYGSGLVYMPDLTGEDGRLTSFALPIDANTAGVRGKWQTIVDATRVFDIEVEIGPWAINPTPQLF